MTEFSSALSALFWGVVVLSLLVFVHEAGHFVMARALGMRVTEFFLGLPSRYRLSRKSRRFGTEFGVTPLLLGGYNRICGMEGEADELLAPALAIVQREGRILAADVARELGIGETRAYTLLAALSDMAAVRPYYDPERDERPWQSEWPAAFETLARDVNLLTEYDVEHDFSRQGATEAGAPRPIEDAAAFLALEERRTYRGKGFVARVLTLLAGPLVNICLAVVLLVGSLMVAGVEYNTNSNELGGVVAGSYADAAGLRAGDVILRLGSSDVSSWTELSAAIDAGLEQGEDIAVAYERDGQTFETVIDLPEGEQVEVIGVNALVETYRPSLVEALGFSFSYVCAVGSMVASIILPRHTLEIVSQSSSIVGISAMASEAAATGLNELVLLAAAISLSLGFMNLLPIPPLDGGKIVIELVQRVIGRPLPERAQNAVSYLGLAFFLFIFCFALRNDIVRLLG